MVGAPTVGSTAAARPVAADDAAGASEVELPAGAVW